MNDFKNGDTVKLKVADKGRFYYGRITKVEKIKKQTFVTVALPSGYYVTFASELWEKLKVGDVSENSNSE